MTWPLDPDDITVGSAGHVADTKDIIERVLVHDGDIAARVRKGDLVFNVRDYGAVGNGTTDDTAGVTAAVAAALAANPTSGVLGGTTNRTPILYFPPGTYLVSSAIPVDLAVTATASADRRRLVIQGAGDGPTVIKATHSTGYLFTFTSGSLAVRDLRVVGSGSNNLIDLGSDATAVASVNQFEFSRVAMFNAARMVRISRAFDGSFYDCGFFGTATGGVSIDIPVHATDNVNNIHFYRCHWENAVGGTFIKAVGSLASASRVHNLLGFHGCHWETRAYNTRAIDFENVRRVQFDTCQFTSNNNPNGAAAGITEAQAVALVRLVNVTNVAFIASSLGKGATSSSWGSKLLALGGNTRGVSFVSCLLDPADNGSQQGKESLWQSDGTVAYTGGHTPFTTVATQIAGASDAVVADEITGWHNPSTRAELWTSRFDTTSKSLRFGYGAGGTDWASGRTDRMAVRKDGGLEVGSYLAGQQQTLADAAVGSFSFAADNNTSKRAMYLITADLPGDGGAIVYSNGSTLQTLAAGSAFAVGNTDPGTATKVNVYLVGSTLTVTNRFGSSRRIAVLPVGFF